MDAVGVIVIALGAIISKERAVELGVSRISGNTLEENLTLTPVQHLLRQSRKTVAGLGLIAAGFVLQILGSWP